MRALVEEKAALLMAAAVRLREQDERKDWRVSYRSWQEQKAEVRKQSSNDIPATFALSGLGARVAGVLRVVAYTTQDLVEANLAGAEVGCGDAVRFDVAACALLLHRPKRLSWDPANPDHEIVRDGDTAGEARAAAKLLVDADDAALEIAFGLRGDWDGTLVQLAHTALYLAAA